MCNGLERIDSIKGLENRDYKLRLPEIVQKHQNPCTTVLKRPTWHQLLAILGSDGDTVLTNLLLDCTIFDYRGDTGSYYQICGNPMHRLLVGQAPQTRNRKSSEISFVRGRILYSKPNLNSRGEVAFGLRQVHILNKLALLKEQRNSVMLQYIFPRQFKLHNVFTSKIDRSETTQPFKDYTIRDDVLVSDNNARSLRIPSRLYANVQPMVERMQRKYKRSRIHQLLYHYCPLVQVNKPALGASGHYNRSRTSNNSNMSLGPFTQQISTIASSIAVSCVSRPEDRDVSLIPYVTGPVDVAAFCCASLKSILPEDAFGVGKDGEQNWASVLSHVDRFIYLRRYETISLHEVSQGLKTKCITWLSPQKVSSAVKLAVTDKQKREELLNEFLYYTFDSLLIPLIATNFYVTESGIHRNKLLYFRQDVWMRLCQPHLESIKIGPLAAVSRKQLREMTAAGHMSYSVIRFLPKEKGMRIITNLKRRSVITAAGKRYLDVSINTRLEPVFRVLQFEKDNADLSSVDEQDLHHQLASFKSRVAPTGERPFFFVKVDIKSAFDSIPQQNLLDLIEKLFRRDDYTLTKHATIKMLAESSSENPSAKYGWSAGLAEGSEESNTCVYQASLNKKHVVYVDIGRRYSISAVEAKKRLEMHIKNNIIKLGHKCRRSTQGIPQGSILSSFLCNFFYDHFVRTKLGFLQPEHSLLLRVIDDFLLITTEKADAMHFISAMRMGDTNYGIVAHPEKSLVNFDSSQCGVQIPKLIETTAFPFCGLLVNTGNLEVSKDRIRKDNVIANTLTVDTNNHAGKKMMRKTLVSLKIQLKNILLDSKLNDHDRVLRSLIECFQESAMKLHQYLMHLRNNQRPSSKLLVKLIQQLIGYCYHVLKDRSTKTGFELNRPQVSYLAALAVGHVLRAKQSRYTPVLLWLESLRIETEHSFGMDSKQIRLLLDKSSEALQHYVY